MNDSCAIPRAPVVECNGARIPAYGIGTWDLRGAVATRVVAEALDRGVRHVDTARMYGNERDVGAGIRESGVSRGELFLTTKILPRELRGADAIRAAEDSLATLDIGYIDLLLIHWPNPDVPLRETLGALSELKRRGVTKHIGMSNFTAAMVDEAVALCDEPLVTNQVEFHPYLDQTKLVTACTRHGMSLTAYSPLAQGRVSADKQLASIGAHYGKSAGQTGLRWLVQHKGVIVIPRTSKIERVVENAGIFDFDLSADEMAWIGSLARGDGRLTHSSFAPAWDS
jgi:2,5-diketo-D-gluconate reductase B